MPCACVALLPFNATNIYNIKEGNEPIVFHDKKGEFEKVEIALSEEKTNLVSLFQLDRKEYVQCIRQLQKWMKEGELYETNFCFPFVFKGRINPESTFLKLNSLTRAPYNCLLKSDHTYVLCASPELFLEKNGKDLISKPIKGTRPRGVTLEEDQQLKIELENDLKELTENRMVVDLVRNDLSQIASQNSVEVKELCKVYSYESVHQMISTIACKVSNNIGLKNILQATFPMGSMTGVPKKRAMELTLGLEPFPRGYYSGSIIDFDEQGNFEANVIIRSIIYDELKEELSFSVGSAITLDANPEKEYEECLLKAKAMMEALNG